MCRSDLELKNDMLGVLLILSEELGVSVDEIEWTPEIADQAINMLDIIEMNRKRIKEGKGIIRMNFKGVTSRENI
jgi:hypothetical protein